MATAQQRNNKRVRLDETTSREQSHSPLDTAKKIVVAHCESLQPELQTLLRKNALDDFLLPLKVANQKKRSVSKMEADPQYFPKSIKLKCQLYCSELAKKDAEYNNLSEELSTAVTAFETSAKATVIRGTKLDQRVHLEAAKKGICLALLHITSSFLFINGTDRNQAHKYANTIMERYHEDILPIFSDLANFNTLAHFRTAYCTFTTAQQPLPNPFVHPAAHLAHNPPGGNAANGAAPNAAINNGAPETRLAENTITQIWTSLRTCFVDSWKAFLKQQKTNDQALELKKFATHILAGDATAAAAMHVDQEPAADQPVLAQLVQQTVAPLINQIEKLQKQVNAQGQNKNQNQNQNKKGTKNQNQRGRRGASRTQTNPGRGNVQQQQPQDDRRAGAHANASSSNSRRNNSSQSNRRSGGRNSNSNRRGNRQLSRSGRG